MVETWDPNTPGSNKWVDGTEEFLSDPGQLVTDPYDTVAGAADAAALNFDEGVGGLSTLFDSEPGNTAGPGESPWVEAPEEGQPSNPGTTGNPLLDAIIGASGVLGLLALLYIVAQLFTFNFNIGGGE